MKKLVYFILIFPVFMLVACLAANNATDAEFKTLRIVAITPEKNLVMYVPTQALVRGPGESGELIVMNIGTQNLIQGMLVLQEDAKELAKLTEKVRQKYGADTMVEKDLTTDVDVQVTCDQQVLWEHRIFTGSNGLPFQVTVPADASASLNVTMKFFPTGAASRAKQEVTSETHVKTYVSSGTESTGGEVHITSSSESQSDQSLGKEFSIEQKIDL